MRPGGSEIPALRVLVTSAAHKVPLLRAVADAARRLNPASVVIAGDVREDVTSRWVADEFWRMPRLDAVPPDALLAECLGRGIDVVVPTRDGELPFWADAAERFRAGGVHVLVAPKAGVERCLDKLAFAELGVRDGFPVIPAALRIDDVAGPRYVVKERYGAGSRRIGLDLDRAAAIAHAATLAAPIFQPFVTGQEISVDSWSDATGRVKGAVLRRRETVVHGESWITGTFRDPAVERAAVRLLEHLRLRGPAVLQAMLGADGQLHVIECNCRFGGASTAGIAAGLDPFYWSIIEALGGDVAALPFQRIPGEVRQVRVTEDLHFHDHRL